MLNLDRILTPVNFNVRVPCPGMMLRRTETGTAVVWLHYSADPTMDAERVKDLRRLYTSEAAWQQEMEINYDAQSGQRVYPDFDPKIHVIAHSKIPKMLTRYMAIDPHPRTPHAMLWIGIDRWSDWYVYRELWPSRAYGKPVTIKDSDEENRFTIRDYCETIAWLEGNKIEWRNEHTDDSYGIYQKQGKGEKVVERFMDQAGKAFRASGEESVEESLAARYNRFGIICSDPYKSHKAGEDAIHDLLKPRLDDRHGVWPRLHISDRCPELALELNRYRYKLTKRMSDEKELKQEGVESRCHEIDLLRYLATSPNVIYLRARECEEYMQ